MRIIFQRMVFDYMKGMRFWILIVFSIILFVTNGILFSADNAELKAQMESSLREYPPNTHSILVIPSPTMLRFINENDRLVMPAVYTIRPRGIIQIQKEIPTNVKLPVVPPMDWTFIITVIFSLFVVIIGYDSMSGEREDGTLKLAFSNSISRSRFCAARYCAIMCVITTALLLGALADAILIGILHPEILTADTFLTAGMVIAAALFLCSIFAFLSILISARMHSPHVALLMLMAIWVCTVIVIPNTAPIIARTISQTRSELQITREIKDLQTKNETEFEIKIQNEARLGKYDSLDEFKRYAFNEYDKLQDGILRQHEFYDNMLLSRNRISRMIARTSPIALFTYATECMTRTGTMREMVFRRAVEDYSDRYDQYILAKVGVLRQSLSGFMMQIEFRGAKEIIASPFPEQYQGDMSDFPRFKQVAFPLSEGMTVAAGDIAGLVLWNLFAALGAFFAVWRMDVR